MQDMSNIDFRLLHFMVLQGKCANLALANTTM